MKLSGDSHSHRGLPILSCGQDSQNPGEKGIHFNLASKFTSGAPRTALGDEGSVLAVGGVDPSSRPAGLSVRTPTAAGNGGGSSSALVTEGKMRSAALARNPSRSTRAWRPAPLLCKRLNVPVPKSALGTGWAAEGGATSAGGAPEQDLVGPRGKFVSTSSATNLPKVCGCCNAIKSGSISPPVFG